MPEKLGGHLMPSGEVAPESLSVTVGTGVRHLYEYPEGECEDVKVQVYADNATTTDAVARALLAASVSAVEAHGHFAVAISGGSALGVLTVAAALVASGEEAGADWSKWHVFFADERVVPLTDADSNFKAASDAFFSSPGVAIPREHVYTIAESLGVVQTAAEYEMRMASLPLDVLPREDGDSTSIPRLDYVLLGCGPDAHVASLFPNRPEVADRAGRWIVPVENAPKPPPSRVSFSMPLINEARKVGIIVMGYNKSEAMQRVLEVSALPGALPAQMVRPRDGELVYYLDTQAASDLRHTEWEDDKSFPRSELPKKPRKGKAK